MTSFHTRLRERRLALNLTQKQVAEAAGVDRTTIAYYEDGKRQPTLTTLIGMCNVLQVDLDWLAGLEEDINKSENVPVYQIPSPGEPLEQPELIVGREMVKTEDNIKFCIVANDNSMAGRRIFKGDLVCVKEKDQYASADVVLVDIEDQGILIRRVVFAEKLDAVVFEADDPAVDDLEFEKHNKPPYRIIGKVAYSKVWRGR